MSDQQENQRDQQASVPMEELDGSKPLGEEEQEPRNDESEQHAVKVEENNEIEWPEASEPFWFAIQIATRPIATATCVLGICIVITGIVLSAGLFELSDSSERDFLIEDTDRTERLDAVNLARQTFDSADQVPVRSQSDQGLTFWVMAKSRSTNVLTVQSLRNLKEAEDIVLEQGNFSAVCWAGNSGPTANQSCSSQAVNRFTDRFTFSDTSPTQEEIDAEVENMIQTNSTDIILFFDKMFSSSNRQSVWIRSQIQLGLPFEGYRNADDDKQGQYVEAEKLYFGDLVKKLPGLEKKYSDVRIYTAGNVLFNIDWNASTLSDFVLAVGSIIFVFSYVAFHTQSTFISAAAALQVILAFPISFFFYRIVARISFFNVLHLMSIFIILGISADDIFVFNDAWHQAPVLFPQLENNMVRRMAWTYRRAAKAMLVTTVTTCAAFLATALSRIMPIAAFGFWSAFLIAVNYILVITYLPAIKVIRHEYMRGKWCWCCCTRKQGKDVAKEAEVKDKVEESTSDEETPEFRLVERVLMYKWLPVVNRFRYAIIAGFLVWFGISLWLALSIEPLSEQEVWLPEDNRIQIGINALEDEFTAREEEFSVPVTFTWGVSGVDRSGTSRWDSFNYGKVVYDSSFSLSAPANQQYLFDVCTNLTSNDLVDLTRATPVECFMTDFQTFVTDQRNETFPVAEDRFITLLDDFSTNTEAGRVAKGAGYIGLTSNDNILRFVSVKVIADTKPFQPYKIQNPIYLQFQDLVKAFNDDAPEGLRNGIQTADTFWSWLLSEREFVDSAIQGVLIAMGFAFFVLMLATGNVILSLYAIVTIAGIVASVMGILKLNGAELGTAESIAVVILIGLSVDYCVHLATAYIESHANSRYNRVLDAVRDIGISIVAGAITTFGSAVFLAFAEGIFFVKFFEIIALTIVFSLLWSLAFFVSVCLVIGPSHGVGEIKFREIYEWFKSFCVADKTNQDPPAHNAKDGVADKTNQDLPAYAVGDNTEDNVDNK